MAESNNLPNNISANDTLDINELASLDEDITPDFIEQLQSQISSDSNIKNDGDLFEDIPDNIAKMSSTSKIDSDDAFAKKYKAKLQKKQLGATSKEIVNSTQTPEVNIQEDTKDSIEVVPEETPLATVQNTVLQEETASDNNINPEASTSEKEQQTTEHVEQTSVNDKDSINAISGGNITERPISPEQNTYREGLNYLDNNVKYSKYVIYIDPENKEFIDSLTVKERKNLINRIIKEQDAIALTKRSVNKVQTIVFHLIVIIITLTLAIPTIYWLINVSLEATINNYRQSQSTFEVLYKEHGKLKKN